MQATYNIADGVLRIVVTGTYGSPEAFELRELVGKLVRESGVRLGLVDLRAAIITHTTLDIYEINTSLDDYIPKDVRFAFVYSPDTLSQELAEFSENVLVNSGYDARVCTDIDEAVRWIDERA